MLFSACRYIFQLIQVIIYAKISELNITLIRDAIVAGVFESCIKLYGDGRELLYLLEPPPTCFWWSWLSDQSYLPSGPSFVLCIKKYT